MRAGKPRTGVTGLRSPDGAGVAYAVLLLLALVLAACDDGGAPRSAEERATEILRARTQGLAYLQEDRLEEAEGEFRRLMELSPGDGAGPANLALVALRRGDAGEAEEMARRAARREPDDPWIRLVLARALELGGRDAAAQTERERALELDPGNLRALWSLAGGSSEHEAPPVEADRRTALLDRIVERAPANLPARLELVGSLLASGDAEAPATHLEEVRSLVPRFPAEATDAFDRALARARRGDAGGARPHAARFHDRMRVTASYQADLQDLLGPAGEASGFPIMSFSHELSLQVPDESAVLEALSFADATEFAGLGAVGAEGGGDAAVVAVGDVDGDGDADLYVWSSRGGGRVLRNDLGRFVDATPDDLGEVGAVRAAAFTDYDADGLLDLYLVRDVPDRFYRNLGGGRLAEVSSRIGASDPGDGRAVAFADLDHDGDLDLVVGHAGGARFYRNASGDGFTEVPGVLGLGRGTEPVLDIDFADFDRDGDLDLVLARGGGGVELLTNLRQGRFRPVTDSVGLGDVPSATAVEVGDYDNDGHPDLVVSSGEAAPRLYRNRGDGRFERDRRSDSVLSADDLAAARATLFDFDNDGHLDLAVAIPVDLAVANPGRGILLLHNDGTGAFEDRSDRLASTLSDPRHLSAFDYNEDGDLDLLVGTPGSLRLLRNDGGNLNHHLALRLVARGPGSGKVNRFGVGSQVELRAGDLYQSRTVRGPVTHIGLGHRLKADVVRIVWTNGVPQYLYYPGTDRELIESRELKGSCAFVYAWNGEEFEFVTDAMWRSALGMPLGIMGRSGQIHASPGASREYLRIPGERLRPHDGRYRLQLTEELWEVAYVDEVRLLAVDHPAGMEVFVDEKFVPPAPPELRLYRVWERLLPVSATDLEGNDLLPALRAQDARYVADLRAGPHQGIVAPHGVVLELPSEAVVTDSVFLFLQGWIHPTDASINVALSHSGLEVFPPRLEVPDGRGGWRTALSDVGFPSGKDKTVVVDLSGVVLPDDPRVRVVTDMEVYWDHAFFAVGAVAGAVVEGDAERAASLLGGGPEADARPEAERAEGVEGAESPRVRLLRPASADLHRRGFSREYRRGGRHGPHWFDYGDVSTDSPWLPIPGRYTRYGDVLPLLEDPDDMYVVMAPGDEMTLEFDAEAVPELPAGRSRTFILYTDGWIKDADLNTADGRTVEPLPFHAQSAYPHGPSDAYPSDPAHRAYLERYQTRHVAGSTLELAPER